MKRLVLGLVFINLSMLALNEQGEIEYRKAHESDLPSILSLMEEASSETDKVMVLPKACRESFVRNLLAKERLFVAVVNNEIAATKKLFLPENTEKNEILHELNCVGAKAELTFRGKINQDGLIVPTPYPTDDFRVPNVLDYGVCLYDGFDFTRKEFRGRGMNTGLFNIAFDAIAPQVKDVLCKTGQKNITLLYGITHANAGSKPGHSSDRTPGIARAFQSFLQRQIIHKSSESIVLDHSRYNALMPVFDLNSKVCRPQPEEKWVSGFGCALTYELKDNFI